MSRITRVVLDILKPHDPDLVAFTTQLAQVTPGLKVAAEVIEIDDKTQTLEVLIEGESIELEPLLDTITTLGASLHSVDGVEVVNDANAG